MKTGRPKKDEKKKKVSFTLNEDVYNLWIIYCEENNILNQSEYIEKIIINNNNDKK